MNNVVLVGRLTRDPELRYIPSGTAVTRFSLAVDKQLSREKKQEFEQKGQPTADFINIVVWGRQAENCANYLAKGRLVAIQGRIDTGRYQDKDGKMVYTTDVVAEQVEFLEWGDSNNSSNQMRQNQYSNDTFAGGNFNQGPSQQDNSSDSPGLDGFDDITDDNIPF